MSSLRDAKKKTQIDRGSLWTATEGQLIEQAEEERRIRERRIYPQEHTMMMDSGKVLKRKKTGSAVSPHISPFGESPIASEENTADKPEYIIPNRKRRWRI